MIQFRPREEDLALLKVPLGGLLPGGPKETMPKLSLLVTRTRPPRVTAVGDVVSRETFLSGILVDLRIVDERSMRRRLSSEFEFSARNTYRVRNPAGVITEESLDAIRRAMTKRDVLILVDGEEDLLTLPCILESPLRALVLYGQPSQGLVVVTVNSALKEKASSILDRMTKETLGPG